MSEDRKGAGAGDGLTLRQRKKMQTRQRISGEATRLFLQRGFEDVTVAEVARAAEVSTMTVFNYFPRKEDLFLDRIPEARELIVTAVRERAEGEPPLAALRRLLLGMVERRHPLGGVGEGYGRFWQVVRESPALRARGHEAVEELEGVLAGLFAEAAGEGAGAGGEGGAAYRHRFAAALIVAACRAVYADAVARQLAGDRVEDVAVEQRERLRGAFDALERALPQGS